MHSNFEDTLVIHEQTLHHYDQTEGTKSHKLFTPYLILLTQYSFHFIYYTPMDLITFSSKCNWHLFVHENDNPQIIYLIQPKSP